MSFKCISQRCRLLSLELKALHQVIHSSGLVEAHKLVGTRMSDGFKAFHTQPIQRKLRNVLPDSRKVLRGSATCREGKERHR